jgi:phosphate acetyltransferase
VNIMPTLEDKVDIVQNANRPRKRCGFPESAVAILSAVETVNPKIPTTIEAAALCKMADRGQITGASWTGRWRSTTRSARKRRRSRRSRRRSRAGPTS